MKYLRNRSFSDIEHWTTELSKTLVDIGPLQKKLSDIPFQPLTYEEQFRLRHLLMDYQVCTNLLREAVNRAKSEKTTPFQRLKHIFDK
jgi:nitrate reductase assembly molybdenum cofactor insertion protein NarJ